MLPFNRSKSLTLEITAILVAASLTQSDEGTWLFGAAAIARESPQEPVRFKLLVIQVPDGVMGGKGRIKGVGKYPAAAGLPYDLNLVDIARRCGANFPMISSNWSHQTDIVSWSTARDQEVVSCLQSKMWTDFNAGLASPAVRGGYTTPDAAPFRQFESADIIIEIR